MKQTRKVDNPLKLDPTNPIVALRKAPSNGQTELTRRYFYEPIYNQQTAVIEERGNPIAADYQAWGATATLNNESPNGSFIGNGAREASRPMSTRMERSGCGGIPVAASGTSPV